MVVRSLPHIQPRNQSTERERNLPRVTQQGGSQYSDSLPMLFYYFSDMKTKKFGMVRDTVLRAGRREME